MTFDFVPTCRSSVLICALIFPNSPKIWQISSEISGRVSKYWCARTRRFIVFDPDDSAAMIQFLFNQMTPTRRSRGGKCVRQTRWDAWFWDSSYWHSRFGAGQKAMVGRRDARIATQSQIREQTREEGRWFISLNQVIHSLRNNDLISIKGFVSNIFRLFFSATVFWFRRIVFATPNSKAESPSADRHLRAPRPILPRS